MPLSVFSSSIVTLAVEFLIRAHDSKVSVDFPATSQALMNQDSVVISAIIAE
jgi:hypothetical protein